MQSTSIPRDIVPRLNFDQVLTPTFFSQAEAIGVPFPLPDNMNSFDIFLKSGDGDKYKAGFSKLINQLKSWAHKNRILKTENLDMLLNQLIQLPFRATQNLIYSSAGIQMLWEILEDTRSDVNSLDTQKHVIKNLIGNLNLKEAYLKLQKAHRKLTEPPFPLPDIEKMGTFMSSKQGKKYLNGLIQLVEKLKQWCCKHKLGVITKNGIEDRAGLDKCLESLEIFINRIRETAFEDDPAERENNLLYSEGIKTLTKIIKKIQIDASPVETERRKDIISNVINGTEGNEGGMITCAPGVNTNITTASHQLASDLPNILMQIREKIALQVIETLRQQDDRQDIRQAHIGSEMHQDVSVLNLYASQLGVPTLGDGHAKPILNPRNLLWDLATVKFPFMIAETLIPKVIIQELLQSIQANVMALLANLSNETIKTSKDVLKQQLNLYGEDPGFRPEDLMLLNEEAASEGREELEDGKIKSPREIELYLMISLLTRLANKKYFDLSTTYELRLEETSAQDEFCARETPTIHIIDVNSIQLGYVRILPSPAPVIPLISYLPKMQGEDLQKVIINIQTFTDAIYYLSEQERGRFITKLGAPSLECIIMADVLINTLPKSIHEKILDCTGTDLILDEKIRVRGDIRLIQDVLQGIPEHEEYLRKLKNEEIAKLEVYLRDIENFMLTSSKKYFEMFYQQEYDDGLEKFISGLVNVDPALKDGVCESRQLPRLWFIGSLDPALAEAFCHALPYIIKGIHKDDHETLFLLPIVQALKELKIPLDKFFFLICSDKSIFDFFGKDLIKSKINSFIDFELLLSISINSSKEVKDALFGLFNSLYTNEELLEIIFTNEKCPRRKAAILRQAFERKPLLIKEFYKLIGHENIRKLITTPEELFGFIIIPYIPSGVGSQAQLDILQELGQEHINSLNFKPVDTFSFARILSVFNWKFLLKLDYNKITETPTICDANLIKAIQDAESCQIVVLKMLGVRFIKRTFPSAANILSLIDALELPRKSDLFKIPGMEYLKKIKMSEDELLDFISLNSQAFDFFETNSIIEKIKTHPELLGKLIVKARKIIPDQDSNKFHEEIIKTVNNKYKIHDLNITIDNCAKIIKALEKDNRMLFLCLVNYANLIKNLDEWRYALTLPDFLEAAFNLAPVDFIAQLVCNSPEDLQTIMRNVCPVKFNAINQSIKALGLINSLISKFEDLLKTFKFNRTISHSIKALLTSMNKDLKEKSRTIGHSGVFICMVETLENAFDREMRSWCRRLFKFKDASREDFIRYVNGDVKDNYCRSLAKILVESYQTNIFISRTKAMKNEAVIRKISNSIPAVGNNAHRAQAVC